MSSTINRSRTLFFSSATQTDEPFIATYALGELSVRNSELAADAADAILTGDGFDRHATAHVLTTLYRALPERAIAHMRRLLGACTDEKVLGAMADNVISDRARFCEGAPNRQLAIDLARKLRDLDVGLDELSNPDYVRELLARFHDGQ